MLKRHLSSIIALAAISAGGVPTPARSFVFDPGGDLDPEPVVAAAVATTKVRRPKSAKRLRNRKRRGWR